MTDRPHTMVVGLGGIGGIVAGHLFEQGHDVVAVTSNREVRDALAAGGFRISGEGPPRIIEGRAVEAPAPEDRFDFILLATQPPQVEAAADAARAALAPGGAMVVFQNGLCEERVARRVGRDRVIGAIIAWGASMVGPGRYERTSTGGFTVGTLDGPLDDRCARLGRLLESIGPVALTENLRGARWTKLAFNCAVSTLGTVGGDRLGPLIRRAFVRRLGLEVMTEAVEVARAEGVRLDRLAGTIDLERLALTPAERRGRDRLSLGAKHALLLAAGARYRRLRSSMLAAIERGRPPAVDFLNGEIVARAREHGLTTPVNDRLHDTVHRIAAGELASGLQTLRAVFEGTRGV